MAGRRGKWRRVLTLAVGISAICVAAEGSANQSGSGKNDRNEGDKTESTPVFTEHRFDLEHLSGRGGGRDNRDDASDDRGGGADDKDRGGGQGDDGDKGGGWGDDKGKGGGGNHGGGNQGGGNHGGGHGGGTPNPAPTPEPGTLLLFATGIASAAGAIRRRLGR
jgi:hypothetical protein